MPGICTSIARTEVLEYDLCPVDLPSLIRQHFPFEPTPGQQELIERLGKFLAEEEDTLFVLKGYAGTGKTTIVSALVKSLPAYRWKFVLLAPTGRAAKVLSAYSGAPALTIHKKIYRPRTEADGSGSFMLQQNLHKNTVFIVDEASMIGEGGGDQRLFPHSLLEDLLEYVYSGQRCRLLLIGDSAQLPPVGMMQSPALDLDHLKKNFGMSIDSVELKDVMRQVLDSGVLLNATRLRISIAESLAAGGKAGVVKPSFELEGYEDIIRLEGGDLLEALENSYSEHGPGDTIIICRSNKRANIYNQQIRTRILWREEEIAAGDQLMIVKNNYFWLPEGSPAGFIANGDTAEILRIRKYREMHGFRFADVELRLMDYPGEPELEACILLDTLHSEAAALTPEQNQRLFEGVMADYQQLTNKRDRYLKMKEDRFFNALQVKFAYAVTCHKAQGGQWRSVFVEQGYLKPEMINTEFLRWLYTALTRTTGKVHLIGFSEEFF